MSNRDSTSVSRLIRQQLEFNKVDRARRSAYEVDGLERNINALFAEYLEDLRVRAMDPREPVGAREHYSAALGLLERLAATVDVAVEEYRTEARALKDGAR